jgi:hypothetical protein
MTKCEVGCIQIWTCAFTPVDFTQTWTILKFLSTCPLTLCFPIYNPFPRTQRRRGDAQKQTFSQPWQVNLLDPKGLADLGRTATRSNRLALIPLGSWGLPKRVTTVKNWSRGISMPIDDTFDTWSKLQFLYVKVSARAARGTNEDQGLKLGISLNTNKYIHTHKIYMCICK